MTKKFLDIEHSRIDTLSDGIFAIALTLMGFDLVGAVKTVSESTSLTEGLANQWPVFFSFGLGFFVLYAIWYSYHVMGQYAGRPHALMVWQHGFGMLFATLVPFGTALLGANLNTHNVNWAVFYFGILIFADAPVQLGFFLAINKSGNFPVSEDSPFTGYTYTRMGMFLMLFVTVFGAISVLIALVSPWLALALYGLHLLTRVTPVTSFNRMIHRLNGILNLGVLE